jgi:hypothetical protein
VYPPQPTTSVISNPLRNTAVRMTIPLLKSDMKAKKPGIGENLTP